MEEEINIVNSNNLAKNIIIVDGFSATGKKLISTYLQTFSRVQKMEVNQIFGQIANLYTFKKIEKESASTILNIFADTLLQNTLLSRDINFRPYDGSSVFKTYNKFDYFKRLLVQDGDNIFKLINEKKPILNIMTHYGMPSIDIFFETFKHRLKFIYCVRHPVYSFNHWEYILENIKKNNKRFSTLNINTNNNINEIPWYFIKSQNNFNQLPGDILIDKLLFLKKLIIKNSKKVPIEFHNSILEIPFENFIMDSFNYQKIITNFINDSPTKNTFKYLKKEKLPSPYFSKRKEIRSGIKYDVFRNEKEDQSDFNSRMNKIKKITSKNKFEELIKYNLEYEKKYKIKYISTENYLNS